VTEEQLLSAALLHSAESVSIYDLDSTVRFMNAATERIMGVKLGDVRGKPLFEHFPDAIGGAFHAAFTRVAAGGEAEAFEHYSPRCEAWYASRVVRVGDHIHVYGRDVTEDIRRRRRLEAQTRISDALTRDELDREGTAQAVAEILTDVLDVDCTLALLSGDHEWLDVVARSARARYGHDQFDAVKRWSASQGHPAEALRTRTAVLAGAESVARVGATIDDAALRAAIEQYAPSSIIVVPLIVADDPIGVLLVTRRSDQPPLTQHERTLLGEVAPSIGLYLALAGRRAETGSLRNRIVALADAIPPLVSFIDRDERYQYVNAGYQRWFGAGREHYLQRTVHEVVGDEAYAVVKDNLKRALAGETVRFRSRIPYPGTNRDVDVQYIPLRAADGGIDGIVALIQDITAEVSVADLERTQREAERRATARLESLLVVTAKLAGAARREDVERVLVDASFEALDASFATMWTLSADERELVRVRERGMRQDTREMYPRLDAAERGPIQDCVRTGKPLFVATREEYAAAYPELERRHRPATDQPIAFAVLPIMIEGTVIGCISFGFYDGRTLTPEERTYLEVLALHGAEALRRASIYAELRDVSETRAAMIQASPAAIMLLDAQGVVNAWNAAAERIFRIGASDAIGRKLPAADQQPDLTDMLRRVLAGEEIHGQEARRMRADGEWFDVECHAAPVKLTDARTMCLSMIVDISQRKRVERGRELIGNASSVFARSLDWQQTLSEIVHLPIEHLASACCVDLFADDGELRRIACSRADITVDVAVAAAAAAGTAQLQTDLAPAASGVRSVLSVPLAVGERKLGALTLAHLTRNFDEVDLSLATELASHASTAIENARLFEDARKARREAEDANRAKDEFLAMLGHELRNPLAPLVTALELMQMRAPDQLARERAVISRQVDHLGRLVDDLLDVSRITRGKVELRRERVPLSNVVAKAIEQTSPLFDQQRHRLTVDVPQDLFLYGDPTRLSQIVANLLSNAAKYTPRDGSIAIFAARRGGRIEVTVRDNGIGIAEEMLPQIFDLFVQAPQPSARTSGGLGLGLTIVRSLVEMHGGTVSVRSDGKGKGSQFTVQLPESAEPAAVNQPERVPQLPRALVARRILVVDDNEDAAKLLAEVLVAHGHHIRTALDGPSALRVADEFQPEVAVLDIGLPVMDGYELAERMRQTPNLAGMRLIAVTGYGQDSDRARALEAGFHAHLAKPVAIETLVRLVDAPTAPAR
jgi:PAS domain S-box-containing protein